MRIKIYVTRGTVDHDDFHENLSQRGFDVPILLQKRSPWRLTLFFVLFFSFFQKNTNLLCPKCERRFLQEIPSGIERKILENTTAVKLRIETISLTGLRVYTV